MNRFLGFAGMALTLLFALACSSGGDGITIIQNIGGAVNNGNSETLFKASGTYQGLPSDPNAVLARAVDANGNYVGVNVPGEIDAANNTYSVDGLSPGTEYDIILYDVSGDELYSTTVSASESTGFSKPGSRGAPTKVAGAYIYEISIHTTLAVKGARAAQRAGESITVLDYAKTVFGLNATTGSLADLTTAQVDDNVVGVISTYVEVMAGLKTVFEAAVATSGGLSTADDFLNSAAVEAALQTTSPSATALYTELGNDATLQAAWETSTTLTYATSSFDDVPQPYAVQIDESDAQVVVLNNATNIDTPNFALSTSASVPAVVPTTVSTIDPFFSDNTFVGAVPSTGTDWTSGWTKAGTDGTDDPIFAYNTLTTEDGEGTVGATVTSMTTEASWGNSVADAGGSTGTITSHLNADGVTFSDNLKRLKGEFHGNVTLTADTVWILSGIVYIGDGSASSNITIEAGTTIRGLDEGTTKGTLVIRKGSQIFAEGTANAPIVMTSAKTEGAYSQDWGGLIICGDASNNENTGVPEGIDNVVANNYGGVNDSDNSGILKYVRVEYGGWQIDSETELNGIAFYSVGSGTTVEYVQVHRNSDDGVEFFGGTVNAKYILITGCEDDSIDWTDGWTGKVQYAIVQQYPGFGDRGIEADSDSGGRLPISHPILSNVTLIGGPDGDTGLLLRKGTEVEFYNSIVMNWADAGIDRDNASYTLASNLIIKSTLFANAENYENDSDGDSDLGLISGNRNVLRGVSTDGDTVTDELAVSTIVSSPFSTTAPDFAIKSTAPSVGLKTLSAVDSFFDTVSFAGAMGSSSDWTSGWTKAGTSGTDDPIYAYNTLTTEDGLGTVGATITSMSTEATWGNSVADTGGSTGTITSHINADGVTYSGNLKRLKGEFHGDVTLTADTVWILSGIVYIGDGTSASNITIEAGTVIRGLNEGTKKGTLVIRKNAQIFAEGTANAPIIMTSAKVAGAYSQDWGGLIINGLATNNEGTGVPEGIDNVVANNYGGADDSDNSGILKYVRVEYGGWQIDSETELNGIAFYAVGSGTTVEYIQVHRNSDDGVEFFGGTVSAKYVLITGCEDDSIDWTDGWRGKLQFAIVQQYPGFGDRGIEADSDSGGRLPISHPILANITLIGSDDGDTGMLFRKGTEAEVYNSIVMNWADAGVDVDNADYTLYSGITIEGVIFANEANFANDSDGGSDEALISGNNILTDPSATTVTGSGASDLIILKSTDINTPNFAISNSAPDMNVTSLAGNSFLTDEDFVGAVGSTDWTLGWTKAGTDGTDDPIYAFNTLTTEDGEGSVGATITSMGTEANWGSSVADTGGSTGTITSHINADGVTFSDNLKRLKGEFHGDVTLTADTVWILSGIVYIGDGTNSSNITIEPGTVIRGLNEGTTKGTLVIRRFAQIYAEGTLNSPIIMTSAKVAGAYSQDWGGLIICGNATNNEVTGVPEGIDNVVANNYGGTDDADNSGVLKYVRVEYGGWQIDSETELNGIAFYSVGSGTEVDYIQVHRNSDDGVEFFGGTVSAKHVLITGCEDDSIDWTDGWRGQMQYAIVQQYPGFGDRGIEADSDSGGRTPVSRPVLANITLIGGADGDTGLLLRKGTEIEFYNSIVMNWGDAGVDVDNADYTLDSGFVIKSTLFSNAANFENDSDGGSDEGLISGNNNSLQELSTDEIATSVAGTGSNENGVVVLVNSSSITSPNFALAEDAPSVTLETAFVTGNAFFATPTFVGGVGASDWTSTWTKAGTDGTDDPIYAFNTLTTEDGEGSVGATITSMSTEANWGSSVADTGGSTGTITSHINADGVTFSDNLKRLKGEFHGDVTLTADTVWILSGIVYIGDGASSSNITIEPGTVIRGLNEGTKKGTLVIRRYAQIFAEGTVSSPIVMTSAKVAGAYSQDWGGLIICGNATNNETTGVPEGIDNVLENNYGGDDDSDSSGVLKYVRVEYGGWQIDSETELNGIAFYSVGNGTTVEYIQVHRNSDDGVEFFGGTVDVKYLVVTGCEDDSIDWTDGWRGKLQYGVVQQYPGFGDRGIEADSDSGGRTPVSRPVISNLTLIGGEDGDTGVLLRKGTEVELYNSIIMNWADAGIDVDNADYTPDSGFSIKSNLFSNIENFENDSDGGSDEALITGNNNSLN